MLLRIRYFLIILIVLFTSCKEDFEAKNNFKNFRLLVVEGYINIGYGLTSIKLSRTNTLGEQLILIPEHGALISIEDDNKKFYQLHEIVNGVYESDSLNLSSNGKYRLRIQTNDGKIYVSDFTEPIQTPSIDSVSWQIEPAGLNISVTTHDINNKTKFYQWEYFEVWEFHSAFRSFADYRDGQFIELEPEEADNRYTCFKYNTSKDIFIESTVNQVNDLISKKGLAFIPINNEKLSLRYSILVKQHALSEEAYKFYGVLLKNNHQLGGFYDPLPSQLPGNLRCISSDEPVIGFVGAATTSYKRIIINRDEVPQWRYNSACKERSIGSNPDSINFYLKDRYNLITAISITEIDQATETVVTIAPYYCVDCRRTGGTNIRPPFWSDIIN